MSKESKRVFFAFVIGQAVQIILSLVAKGCYMDRPILFCGAAGFLVLVAVFAGFRVGYRDDSKVEKPYQYYAERR